MTLAETFTALLVGGSLTIEDAAGSVLSVHAIGAGLAVDAAVATGTGTPAAYTARSSEGEVIGTGPCDLPDIEVGADVVIEALTLEGR